MLPIPDRPPHGLTTYDAKDPAAAWKSLQDSGSTHAVVHRNAFASAADAATVENWLKIKGATEVARFPDGDILLKS
jgi:hypothetical protein